LLKRVSLLPPDLGRWDQAEADALCVGFCADERPLRGAAGLCDWRLCGAISRALMGGRLRGNEGEVTLMPAAGRLPFAKILLFGLGPSQSLSDALCRAVCRQIAQVTSRLGLVRIAVAPPGRLHDRVSAPRALETLIDEMSAEGGRELIVIESIAGQREMAEVLRRLQPGEFVRDREAHG
jgi:cytosol aminopeptidase family protein